MANKLTKDWLIAALMRALRTFCQVALGFLSVGMAMQEVDWFKMISVSLVAAIYSILTSVVANIPEVELKKELEEYV